MQQAARSNGHAPAGVTPACCTNSYASIMANLLDSTEAPASVGAFVLLSYTEVVTLNEQNLLRPEDLTSSELRERASKGGKASAAARRRRRDMKSKMKMILELPVSDCDDFNDLSEMGIDLSEIDNETLMLVGLFQKAKNGDVQAVREIRNIIGKDNDTERLKLQKKQLAIQEKKLDGSPDAETPDDGFLDALNGSAASDWEGEDET